MTDDLVVEAFKKANVIRGLNKEGMFHSDRGSQYTSNDFEYLLEKLEIKHSYNKKGYPYDNAIMESFNAILKKEEVNVNNYETFNEAKLAIFEFIESWYNNQRIHSIIGYITPNEKYNNYIAKLALDPIGAYRMLVRRKIDSDRCHEIADNPLLFYSAQAVHIPNRYEINKDLGVLCDEQDLEEISLKLKRK